MGDKWGQLEEGKKGGDTIKEDSSLSFFFFVLSVPSHVVTCPGSFTLASILVRAHTHIQFEE